MEQTQAVMGGRAPSPNRIKASPLAVSVLCMLHAGPMHPYRLQRLIKAWGKDQVVNVGNRANLYKTIKRLLDAGLITVLQTERDQLYPERTVYQLTEAGRRQAVRWLEEMLAIPRNEYPEFPAALSFAMLLGPDGVRAVLDRRAGLVREQVRTLAAGLAGYAGTLPRVTLLEDEYKLAVARAELRWLSGLLDDLKTGALTWSEESLAAVAVDPDAPANAEPGGKLAKSGRSEPG
jgi:DNA-binding PadR family transcriptional regulator